MPWSGDMYQETQILTRSSYPSCSRNSACALSRTTSQYLDSRKAHTWTKQGRVQHELQCVNQENKKPRCALFYFEGQRHSGQQIAKVYQVFETIIM